jgi:hypothetical protein
MKHEDKYLTEHLAIVDIDPRRTEWSANLKVPRRTRELRLSARPLHGCRGQTISTGSRLRVSAFIMELPLQRANLQSCQMTQSSFICVVLQEIFISEMYDAGRDLPVCMHRLSFLVLLMTMTVLAQSPSSRLSLTITGFVRDPSDAAIVGAQVTVVGADGVTVHEIMTDARGTFRIDKLAPGDYRLDVQKEGFRKTAVPVTLGIKAISPLRIVLPVSVVNQEIAVLAEEVAAHVGTEMAQNQNANSVDREALDRVPVFDRDYITTVSRFLDDSTTGTNGVTLVVNGVKRMAPESARPQLRRSGSTRIRIRRSSRDPAAPVLRS